MTGYKSVHSAGLVAFAPKKPVPGKYPVMLLHGWTGNARSYLSAASPNSAAWSEDMAQAGFSMMAGSLGDGFGAPSETTDIEVFRTWAGTNMPWCDNSKLVLVGLSMGNYNAWGYRRDRPANVAGILGLMPGSDLMNLRSVPERLAGVNASVDAAWGVTYPAALPAGADFIANAATLRGIPYRAYYSTADVVVLPAEVETFRAAMQGESFAAGAGAHGDAIMADVPLAGCIAFLKSCGA